MATGLDVVILRGAPCVGKTTLGRRLKAALPDCAVMEVDDVRGMLANVDWKDRRQHDIAMAGSLDLLRRFVQEGRRPVVLIDTFSRARLGHVLGWMEGAGLKYRLVSMRLQPDDLQRRLADRESGFREWEPSRVLNDEVERNRYKNETLLDVTGLDRDEVLSRALDALGLARVDRTEGTR